MRWFAKEEVRYLHFKGICTALTLCLLTPAAR